MPTHLQLVNRTLSELGRPLVASIDESPDSQAASAKIYELEPELYLEYNWTFLIEYRYDNTPLTTNFSPDYTYTYQLPGNFGKFFKWQATGSQWPIYEFADGLLLAQIKPVGYYYIVNQADPSVYPPLFARAVVLYAACKLAPALTNNVQLTTYLKKEYEQIMVKAVMQNDMERPVRTTPYNDYQRVTFV